MTPMEDREATHRDIMVGFPPPPELRVTLENWQDPPYNRWSFQHVRSLVPSQVIASGTGSTPLGVATGETGIGSTPVETVAGERVTFDEVLARSWTDSVLVLHRGDLVFEYYRDGMKPGNLHLLMSVTKSILGCVAGILAADGVLDPEESVSEYVPEVAGAGYGGARIRDLLDMRTGVAYSEEYENPDAEVRQLERHIGWRPASREERETGLYGFLATLGQEGEHGRDFSYRSADTNMLGWVLERASDTAMAELISERIWQPIGAERDAEITCDPCGSPVHDGGVSASTRDLARFGLLLLNGGQVNGTGVVPSDWLAEARTPDPDLLAAFRNGPSGAGFPGGWYRNQLWHLPAGDGVLQMCRGIYGQMILMDFVTGTVSVKLSTWPRPAMAEIELDTIRAFRAVGEHLATR